MKQRIVRIIGIASAILVIVSSVIYFIAGKMLPGVSPFALAIMMLTMYLKFRVDHSKRGITWILLLAVVLNVVAGISQILAACK